MLRPDSASRRDMVTDHAVLLILERGLSGVSLAAIGGRLGLSAQAVAKWVGSVDQLWLWVLATFGQRWSDLLEHRSLGYGVLAMLPRSDEELGWVRVLLSLDEVARTRGHLHPELAEVHASLRRGERELICAVHPLLVDRSDVARLHSLVDGLRVAVCQPVDPLPMTEAADLVAAECRACAGPLADWLFPMASQELGLPRLVDVNQPRGHPLAGP